jgi:hypothetical protein
MLNPSPSAWGLFHFSDVVWLEGKPARTLSTMSEEITLAGALIAVAHVAKPVVEAGVQFIRDLLGQPIKIAGGMIADSVYLWKLENRVRIAEQAKATLKRKGIPPRQVATGFLLPLLDAAGNVDQPDLQELWAQLLARGVEKDDAQHPAFIETLRRMSAEDARFLKQLAASGQVKPRDRFNAEVVRPDMPVVARLLALGLLGEVEQNRKWSGSATYLVELTGFGAQFLDAVLPK